MTVDMQWIIGLEEEVEALEEAKERRGNLLQMAETEARGREGAKLDILSDCPNAAKEREAIAAAIWEERKGEKFRGDFGEDWFK